MGWEIKKVPYYGVHGVGGPDYTVTAEVTALLSQGWEPFCVTLEEGDTTLFPWLWLKKQGTES